jgi:predicted MPP superfamily phosphohydrolase
MWAATIPYQGLEILAAAAEIALAFRLTRRYGGGATRIVRVGLVLAAIGLVLVLPAYALFLATDRWVAPLYAHLGTQFWAFGVLLPAVSLFRIAITRERKTAATLLLGLSALGCLLLSADALLVEPDRLQVEHEIVRLPGVHGDGVRIAHVSDLQTTGWGKREERALEAVRAMKADFVVFTGDYISKGLDCSEQIAAARRFLRGIEAPFGVFCVAGDSEEEVDREIVFAGLDSVHYLKNESYRLDVRGVPIVLVGLQRFKFDAQAAYRDVPRDLITIVIHHDPDILTEISGRRVDLLLAGHTHGGQVCLPWLGPVVARTKLGRARAAGLFEVGGVPVHVSRGIGLAGKFAPRVRFLCPPEVTLITLQPALR